MRRRLLEDRHINRAVCSLEPYQVTFVGIDAGTVVGGGEVALERVVRSSDGIAVVGRRRSRGRSILQ